jgi:RNA ligase
MSYKKAPYRHKDGSNCWTKNCSRGSISNDRYKSDMKSAKVKEDVAGLPDWFDGPTPIDVIAPIQAFEDAERNKDITRQRHPDYPYSICKYSQSTVFTKKWNEVTLASRGLVINDETGEIVARPFGKFFNYSEGKTPPELMTGPITVAEKLDGSLGISYMTPDGMQITTAGGFQSEQAAHATALYREKYEGNWKPRKNTTYMWEIIYPKNRIVVDYGKENDIHLLGAVNIRTGKSIPLKELKEWKWKRAEEYDSMTSLDQVVKSEDRSNHEGYIVHFTDTDTRVKFKHDEYLQHHKYATGINSRRIWEMMRDNENIDSYLETAPEEFEDYIKTTRKDLQKKYDAEVKSVENTYTEFRKTLPADVDQKTFAQAVNSSPLVPRSDRSLMFSKFNTGEFFTHERSKNNIWERIKPDFDKMFASNEISAAKHKEEDK